MKNITKLAKAQQIEAEKMELQKRIEQLSRQELVNKIDDEKSQQIEWLTQLSTGGNELDLDLLSETCDIKFEGNCDGIIWNSIFEFKKTETKKKALSQVIGYLSKRRIAGKNIPCQIFIIIFEKNKVYRFWSKDYLTYIEKQHKGPSSLLNIEDLEINPNFTEFNLDDYLSIYKEITSNNYSIKVNVDITNVIGISNTYYKQNPSATKLDFFDELRNPTILNTYPWIGNEEDFSAIQDCLNAPINRRDLGAFYTPPEYAELGRQLVREAIERVPEGNDYVIIDTCAGTGNLEEGFDDEILSHCVVSTYETIEWMVLNSKLGDKVREILPIEFDITKPVQEEGNALNYKVLPGCQKYVDNEKCTVIVFENPPYKAGQSGMKEQRGKSFTAHDTVINKEMKEKGFGKSTGDLGFQFIWKAAEYYLTQPEDSFILYSPISYYTVRHLINLTPENGYLLNRKEFHATPSSIALIRWSNIKIPLQKLALKVHDGKKNIKEITLTPLQKYLSTTYDPVKNDAAVIGDGIVCNADGSECINPSNNTAVYRDDMLAVYNTGSATLDALHFHLTRGVWNGHESGGIITEQNILTKLPLYQPAFFPTPNWYDKGTYTMSADGGDIYLADKDFLKSCLIFTCLSLKNKVRAIDGSDGRFYQNELCLLQNTIADKKLAEFELTSEEKKLLDLWQKILDFIKETDEYEPRYNYNPWQISQDIDLGEDDGSGKINVTKSRPPIYEDLHEMMVKLDKMNKEYYMENIYNKLFQYEIIK